VENLGATGEQLERLAAELARENGVSISVARAALRLALAGELPPLRRGPMLDSAASTR
jgi:hypothetical protein